MKKFAIARRYAKALFIIGKKDGNFEKYLNELLTLNEVIEKEKKLWEVLVNPLFEFDIRKKILKEVGERLKISDIVVKFLLLLLENNRFTFFPEIMKIYQQMTDNELNRARATIYTSFKLDEKEITKIVNQLEKRLKKEIIPTIKEDPSILGGIKAQVGGIIFDGSLKTQLERFRQNLIKG